MTVVKSTITKVYRATAARASVESVSKGEDGQEPSVWRLPALVKPALLSHSPHPVPRLQLHKNNFPALHTCYTRRL